MRTKCNTTDLFIAEEIPWLFAIMLLGFVLIFSAIGLSLVSQGVWAGLIFGIVGGGMGVIAMGVFVERLQLILNAQAQTVTIRSRTIFRHHETNMPLADLNKAIVETTHSRSNRRTILSRASLVMQSGSGAAVHPITQIYSSGNNAKTVVQNINTWLENLRPVVADIDSPLPRR